MPHEKRSSHSWIWLLAILLAALLLFFFTREGGFSGRRAGQQAGTAERNRPEARETKGENLKGAQTAGRPQPGLPLPAGIPSSDDWYMTVAFKGVVRNESNRTPVEGAAVAVYARSSPPTSVENITGNTGTFQVVAPPAHRYQVKVTAEGFRPYEEDSFVITRPYYDMEIFLTPVMMLRGRVVDPMNAGIADAVVQARTAQRSSSLLTTTTDSQGGFTFSEVARFGRLIVEAYHPAYDTLGAVNTMVPSENLILRMRPAPSSGSLAGAVMDTEQKPVAGAEISLLEASDSRLTSIVQTDAQGQYRVSKVRGGYYLVRCTAQDYPDARANQSLITITANRETRLDFSMDPGLAIRGFVMNQKEEPVVQAQIRYMTEDPLRDRMMSQARGRGNRTGEMSTGRNLKIITTDDEGRFQILGLPDAQISLTVSHRDYLSLSTTLRPSNQMQRLTLDGGLALRGTVTDNRGRGVERFTLSLQSASGKTEKSCSFTTTDGHFEIRGLARDTYRISLQGRGRYSGTLDLQSSSEVHILLESGPGGRGESSLSIMKSK